MPVHDVGRHRATWPPASLLRTGRGEHVPQAVRATRRAARDIEFILRVEAEEVGYALSAIGSRHVLRLVDNVGKVKPCLAANSFRVALTRSALQVRPQPSDGVVVHGWSVSLPRVVKMILGGGFAF
jgi:hypothetical protein